MSNVKITYQNDNSRNWNRQVTLAVPIHIHQQ